jgi:ATP-dependent exoDNAse (exonuclease V) beta subunit
MTNPSVIKQLSEDGQQRLNRILPHINHAMAERERVDLRHHIENTWLLLGGPACLHDASDLDDAKTYFELLDEFAQHYQQANLDQLITKIEHSYAQAQSTSDAVQIMTIHSAKGLEFDTVILPHLERKMPSDDKSLLAWMEQPLSDGNIALLLAPIHATGDQKELLYEYINKQKKIKNNFETDRLLYVAATRAKKRLYLCYGLEKHQADTRTESGSFLAKLWPLIHHQSILGPSNQHDQTVKAFKPTDRAIKRLTTAWVNPIRELTTNTPTIHQTHQGFRVRDDYARKLGVVIHKLLQNICEYSTTWWTSKDISQHQQLIQKLALSRGVRQTEIPSATRIILTAIQNTLSDQRGQWILQPHQDAHSEFALSAILNQTTEHLVIDRTFKDEHGTRWIIDYKTSTPETDDLSSFLEKEKSTYQAKLALYAEAMKLTDSSPLRLGLYFPLIPAWIEWES